MKCPNCGSGNVEVIGHKVRRTLFCDDCDYEIGFHYIDGNVFFIKGDVIEGDIYNGDKVEGDKVTINFGTKSLVGVSLFGGDCQ